jgi:hypothetical protein
VFSWKNHVARAPPPALPASKIRVGVIPTGAAVQAKGGISRESEAPRKATALSTHQEKTAPLNPYFFSPAGKFVITVTD